MNLQLPEAVSRNLARQALLFSKNSPTIFFAAGVAGTIASTALACRATLKLEAVMDKADKDLQTAELVHLAKPEEYPVEELAEIKKAIRMRTIFEVAELFAPAIGVGALAISALAYSHDVLSRRNAALGAAYAAIDQAFREYRSRVVETYGEDKDRELRYGSEKVSVVGDDGRKKNVHRVGDDELSGYARYFDDTNPNWDANREYNLLFLRGVQNHCNDRLQTRGYVMLSEVYEALGLKQSTAAQVVGWVVGCHGEGDQYIDFGVFGDNDMGVVDFVNGRGDQLLLDFNVDGEVFRLLDKINDQEAAPWQS